MTPKFNKWYIKWNENVSFDDGSVGSYPDMDIFWLVNGKVFAFSKTHYSKRASWGYDLEEFDISDYKLATPADIKDVERYFSLDIEQAKRDTIKDIMDPKRDEDD